MLLLMVLALHLVMAAVSEPTDSATELMVYEGEQECFRFLSGDASGGNDDGVVACQISMRHCTDQPLPQCLDDCYDVTTRLCAAVPEMTPIECFAHFQNPECWAICVHRETEVIVPCFFYGITTAEPPPGGGTTTMTEAPTTVPPTTLRATTITAAHTTTEDEGHLTCTSTDEDERSDENSHGKVPLILGLSLTAVGVLLLGAFVLYWRHKRERRKPKRKMIRFLTEEDCHAAEPARLELDTRAEDQAAVLESWLTDCFAEDSLTDTTATAPATSTCRTAVGTEGTKPSAWWTAAIATPRPSVDVGCPDGNHRFARWGSRYSSLVSSLGQTSETATDSSHDSGGINVGFGGAVLTRLRSVSVPRDIEFDFLPTDPQIDTQEVEG
eukprot:Polyplicarium_translucidae@DN5223_c0_g1_i1.p1